MIGHSAVVIFIALLAGWGLAMSLIGLKFSPAIYWPSKFQELVSMGSCSPLEASKRVISAFRLGFVLSEFGRKKFSHLVDDRRHRIWKYRFLLGGNFGANELSAGASRMGASLAGVVGYYPPLCLHWW